MNIYTSDNAVTSFIKHKLQKIEREINKNTVITEFNTLLSLKNRLKKKKNIDIYNLNNVINKVDIDTCLKGHTILSRIHETFSKFDYL